LRHISSCRCTYQYWQHCLNNTILWNSCLFSTLTYGRLSVAKGSPLAPYTSRFSWFALILGHEIVTLLARVDTLSPSASCILLATGSSRPTFTFLPFTFTLLLQSDSSTTRAGFPSFKYLDFVEIALSGSHLLIWRPTGRRNVSFSPRCLPSRAPGIRTTLSKKVSWTFITIQNSGEERPPSLPFVLFSHSPAKLQTRSIALLFSLPLPSSEVVAIGNVLWHTPIP